MPPALSSRIFVSNSEAVYFSSPCRLIQVLHAAVALVVVVVVGSGDVDEDEEDVPYSHAGKVVREFGIHPTSVRARATRRMTGRDTKRMFPLLQLVPCDAPAAATPTRPRF